MARSIDNKTKDTLEALNDIVAQTNMIRGKVLDRDVSDHALNLMRASNVCLTAACHDMGENIQ